MPSAGPSSIAEELAPWVGTGGDINLSGGASNYILQGGVTAQTTSWYQQHGSAPQTNYYLWTENYPDPPATSTSLPLTPGHSMYVSMDWSYNAAKYTVFWEDVTTGQYTSWTRSVSQPGTSTDNPGTSGDCIAEEQGTHYQFPDPQFNYCYLEQGAPGVTGIGNYLDDEFYTEYDMMVGTVSYALPYIVNPHSGSFRMTVYPG